MINGGSAEYFANLTAPILYDISNGAGGPGGSNEIYVTNQAIFFNHPVANSPYAGSNTGFIGTNSAYHRAGLTQVLNFIGETGNPVFITGVPPVASV
jgi:hypothetical protein